MPTPHPHSHALAIPSRPRSHPSTVALALVLTLQVALASEKNNHSSTLNRLSREAEALYATYCESTNDQFAKLSSSALSTKKEVLGINGKFRDSWKLFAEGGIFNAEERQRFVTRLAAVDEGAEAEAVQQIDRLNGLQAEQVSTSQELPLRQ